MLNRLAYVLFALLVIGAAFYLCATQPMTSGDLNRLRQRFDYVTR